MTQLLDQRPDTAASGPEPTPSTSHVARSRATGAVTLGLVLVALGVMSLLMTLDVDVPLRIVGPVLLVIVGLGVVISGARGEPDGGLLGLAVLLGMLLSVGAIGSAVLDVPLRGGVGERQHTPATLAEMSDEYRLLAGDLRVDLREVDFEPGTAVLEVSVVLGQVEVLLPPDVAVSVDSEVGGGTATVFGAAVDGLSVDNDRRSEDYDRNERRLDLRVRVGLGESRVTR